MQSSTWTCLLPMLFLELLLMSLLGLSSTMVWLPVSVLRVSQRVGHNKLSDLASLSCVARFHYLMSSILGFSGAQLSASACWSSGPKLCTPKLCIPKLCTPKLYTPKLCMPKLCTPKLCTPKLCTPKLCMPKLFCQTCQRSIATWLLLRHVFVSG